MSLLNTVTDMPLKSPTAELLFYESPLSNLLYEIRTSEAHYRDQLSKLLGCCSPLKRQVANGLTNSIRKLIAYHTDLVRLLDHAEERESIMNFINWSKSAVPVYQNYVHNYQLGVDDLKLEVQLKKSPLMRINQLAKFFNKIVSINESYPQYSIVIDDSILKNLTNLMELARDKNEKENLRIDLNTLLFDNVHSLSKEFSGTVAYFQLDQVIKRDYFKFDLLHQKCHHNDLLVEVFQLSDNSVAICSVQSVGRSLMFPPLRQNEFDILVNNLDSIHLENEDGVEIRLTCPDRSQLSYWNNVFANLFGAEIYNHDFMDKIEHLGTLRNNKIGLGINMEAQKQPQKSLLRKSSPIISRHPSLNIQSSPTMNTLADLSPSLANIEQYFSSEVDLTQTAQTPKSSVPKSKANISLKNNAITPPSPTLPLNIKKSDKTTRLTLEDLPNSSTVSLPNFPNTKASASLNINEKVSGSSVDLSRFDNIKPNLKVKKRKSIFNIFSKKNNEPDFEIVTKSTINTPQPPSNPNSNSISTSTSTSTSTIKPHESTETISSEPKQSMASLQKNVKNLTISTSSGSVSSQKGDQLPSPFGRSATNLTNSLTPLEEATLSSSTVLRVFKNNTILSKWSFSHWESIGTEYQNTMKFISTAQATRVMTFYTDSRVVPTLMIPLENCTVSKSSALDAQIKCFAGMESKRSIMLNVRTKDVYTLKMIMNEFEGKNQDLSASSSDVFSAPSNSTSMSSVSVDEIQELGKPGAGLLGSDSVYGGSKNSLSQIAGSQTSLGSTGSTIPCQTLLLKSDIKVKLHKMDEDEEWRPISIGKFNISSNLGNPEFSKFDITCSNKFKLDCIVKNDNCERLGKSGLRFNCLDDMGDELYYLIEFRNKAECEEIYEMLI